MSSLLPWPDEHLLARSWDGVGLLLDRCMSLHRGGSLPATLLLLGESGFGREALAIDLAAGLVCPEGGEAGCECHSCRRARRGIHPDVEIVRVEEGSQEIKVKQAEDLVLRLPQVPYEGQRRAIIVDSAHTPPLNLHAATALLKALEEPPSHVTLLLLAANPSRVLPTVVSRAVTVRIPPPSEPELEQFLAALHGVDPSEIAALVAVFESDLPLLANPAGPALKAVVSDLGARLLSALGGDGLGLTTAAALVRQLPAGHELAARALLRSCRGLPAEQQEIALHAAARLLAAAHRTEVLRIDAESTALAALAPLVVRSSPR